jgi:hypothetical protein
VATPLVKKTETFTVHSYVQSSVTCRSLTSCDIDGLTVTQVIARLSHVRRRMKSDFKHLILLSRYIAGYALRHHVLDRITELENACGRSSVRDSAHSSSGLA